MRKPVPDDGRFMKDEGTEPFPYLRCFPEGSLFLDCLLLFSVAGVGNPIGSDLGKRLGGGSVPAGFGFSGFVKTDCGPGAESNSFGLCRDARLLQIESLKYNNKMKRIVGNEFGGERPLFASCDLCLEDVTVHAGESALKECRNIEAVGCRFEGKYPFWHNDGFVIRKCLFTEGARAALWYSRDLRMSDTRVEAPKMFREMDGVRLENVQIPNAQETLWHCRNVDLKNVRADRADYLFLHGENIRIEDYVQNGN